MNLLKVFIVEFLIITGIMGIISLIPALHRELDWGSVIVWAIVFTLIEGAIFNANK